MGRQRLKLSMTKVPVFLPVVTPGRYSSSLKPNLPLYPDEQCVPFLGGTRLFRLVRLELPLLNSPSIPETSPVSALPLRRGVRLHEQPPPEEKPGLDRKTSLDPLVSQTATLLFLSQPTFSPPTPFLPRIYDLLIDSCLCLSRFEALSQSTSSIP